VKLNDWELAEFVRGPVSEPSELRAAAERLPLLRDAMVFDAMVLVGARSAIACRRRVVSWISSWPWTLSCVSWGSRRRRSSWSA